MNADRCATFWAGPALLFVSDKLSYTKLLYSFEIIDHAHAVLGPVTFIQVLQAGARKAFTSAAVLEFTLC